jgi:hypothetical protein
MISAMLPPSQRHTTSITIANKQLFDSNQHTKTSPHKRKKSISPPSSKSPSKKTTTDTSKTHARIEFHCQSPPAANLLNTLHTPPPPFIPKYVNSRRRIPKLTALPASPKPVTHQNAFLTPPATPFIPNRVNSRRRIPKRTALSVSPKPITATAPVMTYESVEQHIAATYEWSNSAETTENNNDCEWSITD